MFFISFLSVYTEVPSCNFYVHGDFDKNIMPNDSVPKASGSWCVNAPIVMPPVLRKAMFRHQAHA